MDTISRTQPPIWYWIGTALFVLFALLGALGWLRTLIFGPSLIIWALVTAGPAILSDAVGALGLVLRKVWAVPALAIALTFAALYCAALYFVATPDVVGSRDASVALGALVLFGAPRALALWLALASNARGWSAHGVARGVVPAV